MTCDSSLWLYPLDHAAAVRPAPPILYASPVFQAFVRTSRKVDIHVCGELYMFAFLVQVYILYSHWYDSDGIDSRQPACHPRCS